VMALWWYLGLGGVGAVVAACYFLKDKAQPFQLQGKSAIVTGGSSGIGFSTAEALVRAGCHVAIFARDQKKLQQAEADLKSVAGPKQHIAAISVDVSDARAVEGAVKQVVQRFSSVDILVASAGVSRPGNFLEIPVEDFDRLMRINYLGSAYTARAVAPYMKQQGSGRICFVSSMAGLFGMVGFSAYSPSKSAVRALAESIHMELRPYNVYTSVCYPPDVDTPMLKEELKHKPEVCRIISEGSGLFTPEALATAILNNLRHWSFNCTLGFDGFLLSNLTVAFSPASSTLLSLFQVVACGPLRLVACGYLWSWNRLCERHAR